MKRHFFKSLLCSTATCSMVAVAALAALPAHAVQPAVSVGYDHVVLLRADGTVWSWGNNNSGQLGLGQGIARTETPKQIVGLQDVVQVVARGSFSMALKADGTVWAWGDNSGGRTGTGSGGVPVQINGLDDIVSINAGTDTAAAFATDVHGRVFAWGSNSTGQLGTGQTSGGSNKVPQLVTGASGVVGVSANDSGALALREDGQVLAWGYNRTGVLLIDSATDPAVPTLMNGLQSVQAVASTSVNSGQYYVLTDTGAVKVWGQSHTAATFCGQDGTRTSPYSQIDVSVISGLSRISQIEPGHGHTLFIDADGAVHACGKNERGQLGDGTTVSPSTDIPKIAHVAGLPAVAAAGAGSSASAAIGVDGSVWVWGQTTYLAEGGQATTTQPRRVTLGNGAPFDAGRVGEAPGTFAGVRTGPLSDITLDVAATVSPLHRGKTGRVYVAALLGPALLLLGPEGWAAPHGGVVPAYFSGALPRLVSAPIASGHDFSGLEGVSLVVGYGVGDDQEAPMEMLRSGRFQLVHTLN